MNVNFLPLLPAVQVLLTALVVLIRDLFISERESKGYLAFISLLGIGLAMAESLALWGGQEGAFDDSLMLVNFALYFSLIFLITAALTILTSIQYLRLTAIHEGEFYALVLFATVGMMIMAAANDLLIFFLGLETMSIAVYVLTGMWRAKQGGRRSRHEIFFHGRLCHRLSTLRDRADLWRHRLNSSQCHRRCAGRATEPMAGISHRRRIAFVSRLCF